MSTRRYWNSTALGLVSLLLAGAAALAQQPQAADPTRNLTPVTDAMLRDPPASDWLMWRRTYNGWGYSPLDQINKDNVKNLQVAWSWSLTSGATETTPIVHDGVLYIFNYGNKIQALNAATGDLIWEYKRDLPARLIAGTSNLSTRNLAIYQGNLIAATSDAHIVALDAKSGKVVWDHATADWTKGWRYTGGPFIINGKVIQGMTGCGNAEPGGCFITGNDSRTGEELWRVNTIAHPGDPNYDTWNGLPMESRFGASAWISGSYDPDQNLVFYGTGQPYPWIAEMRGTLPAKPGAKHNAMYSDSTLAINPDTGQLKWYHQHLEDDTWDLDYVYERLLVDLPVNGETRKAVVTSGKLGILEALDRTNGEWLWHKETVPQNVVASIDPKTGEKTINPAAIPHIGVTTVNCPADPGGRGWPATAYNPKTGRSSCRSTSIVPTPRRRRSIPARPIAAAAVPCLPAGRCPTATAMSAGSTPSRCRTARPPGAIGNARRTPARCCRPPAAWCSSETSIAISRRSTKPPARCCGAPAPTTRSTRSRSATASTASNMSRSRPATDPAW